MAPNQQDAYGKRLLRTLLGNRFQDGGPGTVVVLARGSARLDGLIDGECAVEIEARNQNQVHVAVLHLLLHSAALKLLVLMRVNLNNPEATAADLQYMLDRLRSEEIRAKVVLLGGNGDAQRESEDIALIAQALSALGLHVRGSGDAPSD